MALTADQQYLLSNRLNNHTANKLQLGSLFGVHRVAFAASVTTAGGAAAEAITVTGLLATDIVSVTHRTQGAGAQTILSAAPTADTLTVTFSADPSTDNVIDYVVHRAISV